MYIRRWIFIVIMNVLALPAYALNLTVEVDRGEIALNESLRLIVTADEITRETIDFTKLSLQFDILNTQRSSQQTLVNGALSATTRWILILSPKEAGKLLIPSFELRGIFSPAISITVNDVSAPQGLTGQRDVFLQASVDKTQVYVQEQILLKFTLYYRVALSGYDADDLKIDNATIALVSEKNFQTALGGQNFKALELVYAIHPQASGELLIPEQFWRLERGVAAFSFGRPRNPSLRVGSEPIRVTVNGIPANYQGEHWLPAKQVTLTAEWSDVDNVAVGEPINVRLRLTADGLSDSQLPDLAINSPASFNVFSDQPDAENEETARGIVGSRTSPFAVIPQEAGTLTFPEVVLRWWNIEEDREAVVRLPAKTVFVAPSEQNTASLPELASADTADAAVPMEVASNTWIWQVTTALFALIAAYLGFCLYQTVNRSRKPLSTTHSVDDSNLRELHGMLRQALANSNWQGLRLLIVRWGGIVDDSGSLTALMARHPSLKCHLEALEHMLYDRTTNTEWDPEGFYNELRKIKPRSKHQRRCENKPEKTRLDLKALHRFS